MARSQELCQPGYHDPLARIVPGLKECFVLLQTPCQARIAAVMQEACHKSPSRGGWPRALEKSRWANAASAFPLAYLRNGIAYIRMLW